MFCQPLDKIIVSDFVTLLMKVQIKTKNAGPGLGDFLICKPDTRERNEFCLTGFVLTESVLVPRGHCFFS